MFARPYQRIVLTEGAKTTENIHVAIAVGEEGIVHYKIIEGRYRTENYHEFIEELFQATGEDRRVALFFDGHTTHTTAASYRLLL